MKIPVEKLRILAGLAVLLSFAASGFAEEDSCRHRILPVTVVDSVGRPIPGFIPADFQANFQGKPLQILSVNKNSHPHRVVILLDVSGSMHMQGDKWTMAREVASDAVAHMPGDIQVALEIFDTRVVEALDFGSGRTALAQKIIDLAPGAKAIPSKSRRTALWDSLSKAVLLFGPPQLGDTVYLISDGGDNVSKTGAPEVENAFLPAGVRLFVFLLVSRSTLGYLMPDEEQGLNDLKGLVEVTGGNLMVLSRGGPPAWLNFNLSKEERTALASRARVLYAEMKEFSRLEVNLPKQVSKTRHWSLQLNRSGNTSLKDLSLLYPHKLAPCSRAQAPAAIPTGQ